MPANLRVGKSTGGVDHCGITRSAVELQSITTFASPRTSESLDKNGGSFSQQIRGAVRLLTCSQQGVRGNPCVHRADSKLPIKHDMHDNDNTTVLYWSGIVLDIQSTKDPRTWFILILGLTFWA